MSRVSRINRQSKAYQGVGPSRNENHDKKQILDEANIRQISKNICSEK